MIFKTLYFEETIFNRDLKFEDGNLTFKIDFIG